MTYSDFEKNTAKKINQYASGIDAEALWSGIQPHVPVEKKKRRGFFWFFLGGILLLSSAAYLWNESKQMPNPNVAEFSTVPFSEKAEHTIDKKESDEVNRTDEATTTDVNENPILINNKNNKKY